MDWTLWDRGPYSSRRYVWMTRTQFLPYGVRRMSYSVWKCISSRQCILGNIHYMLRNGKESASVTNCNLTYLFLCFIVRNDTCADLQKAHISTKYTASAVLCFTPCTRTLFFFFLFLLYTYVVVDVFFFCFSSCVPCLAIHQRFECRHKANKFMQRRYYNIILPIFCCCCLYSFLNIPVQVLTLSEVYKHLRFCILLFSCVYINKYCTSVLQEETFARDSK